MFYLTFYSRVPVKLNFASPVCQVPYILLPASCGHPRRQAQVVQDGRREPAGRWRGRSEGGGERGEQGEAGKSGAEWAGEGPEGKEGEGDKGREEVVAWEVGGGGLD